MKIRLHFWVRAAGAAFACLMAGASIAQPAYPTKPVRLVVPFAAGGPVDVLARALGAKLSTQLGQQFIVDNKAGGGSVIAWDHVAKSPADGYTLLVAGIGSRTILPYVAKIPFDPAKDLLAVTRLADAPNVLVANPAAGYKSLADVVTKAKASPGKVNIAIPAPATVTHFASTILQQEAGIQLTEVPYKGGAPAVNAVMAGEVELMSADIGAVLPQIQAGRLVALATASPKRLPQLPQLPTTAESGYPQLLAVNVYGLFAPAGTPKDIVSKLSAAVAQALRSPEAREQLGKLGMVPETSSPEAFESYLQQETARWAPVAKASGVRLN
jgi:tripartite-type tricarboxylate transporter receptor subunit TctC